MEKNNKKFGKIYDISELNIIPLTFLHEFAKNLNKFRERTDAIVIATSVIVNSIIIRGLLNVFLTLYNNTRPLEAFDNQEDSENFIYQFYNIS